MEMNGEMDEGEAEREVVAIAERDPGVGFDADEVPSEVLNVVDLLDEAEQAALARRVCDGYETDIKSRKGYIARRTRWQKLYSMVREPKSFPFHNSANVTMPLLATAVIQIQARLFDMLYPADGMVFESKPSTNDQEEVQRAWRTELYLNHYVRRVIADYEIGLDDSLFQVCCFGSAFRYRAWSPMENRIVVKWISVDDFVVNYAERCTDPAMRGVPRYSWMHYLTLDDLAVNVDADGYYSAKSVKAVKEKAREPGAIQRSEFREAVDKADGKTPPAEDSGDETATRQVIQQYIKVKLPKRPKKHAAFDGKRHFVAVDVDVASEQVLRVAIREEDDPRDVKRYTREVEAYAAELQRQQEVSMVIVRRAELAAKSETGVLSLDETGELGALMQQDFPEDADEPEAPRAVRKREICYFTHLRGFPGEGFYGMSFGDFVGPLNEAANTIFNQVIDAMTLQNAGGGWLSRSLRGPRGDLSIQPGKYQVVDGSPQAIRDGIQHNQFPGPSPVSLPVVQEIAGMAQQVSASGNILSGEKGASNETATTTKIRAEMAIKQISVLSRRMVAYLRSEAEGLWRLLSLFLDEDDAVQVVNAEGQPATIPISRADFVADANVTPSANPQVGSRVQRIEEAQERLSILVQHPLTAQNPMIQAAALEDLLRAQGAYRYVTMLRESIQQQQEQQKQAAEQQQMGPPPMPQDQENVAMLSGQPVPVHPEDNHAQHLHEIALFAETPAFGESPPQTKQLLAQHRLEHLGQMYLRERRPYAGTIDQRPRPGGMAPPAGNAGPSAATAPPPA
jgi:hypothetical protein